MAGEPEITIVGTLGADPELRFTPAGKAVASMSVAVGSRKKNAEGRWEDDGTTWYRCTVWETPAENVAESLSKGDRVMVQGRLRMREYETRDGVKGRSLEMQVSAVGPELRYATAKVSKLRRDAAPDNQGWAGDAGQADEPPF